MFDWWINITKCLLCFSLFRWNMCQMSVQETEEGKFLHICSFSPHFYVETNVIVVKHNTNATFYNRTVNMDELSKTFLFTNPFVCVSQPLLLVASHPIPEKKRCIDKWLPNCQLNVFGLDPSSHLRTTYYSVRLLLPIISIIMLHAPTPLVVDLLWCMFPLSQTMRKVSFTVKS